MTARDQLPSIGKAQAEPVQKHPLAQVNDLLANKASR
jgi:hypothetical protein